MREPISVTIITKNEEKNIERCLKSVEWADEIVVVDSGSTDYTIRICEKYKCKIIKTSWLGFGKTKQLAVDSASYNWILSLDADEVVTPKLQKQIIKIIEKPDKKGYKIKRTSFYLGKNIKFCGWNRDFPLRLFHKEYGRFNKRIVHESVQINEPIGFIYEAILHYTYPDLNTHLTKMTNYSVLSSENLYKKGKKISVLGALLRGCLKFIKMYFIQLGFLDGKNGLILSFISAFGVSYKYLNLWELKRKRK